MLYGAGARTSMFEHEKMIRSTGREMLRLVVQTTRKYKVRKDSEEKDRTDDEWSNNGLSTETEDENSTSRADDEEEDWIHFIKRSTRVADEKMRTFWISCWIERKLTWQLAKRIPSHSEEKWTKKAEQCNLCLISSTRSSRCVGKGNDLRNNGTWVRGAKDQKDGKKEKKKRHTPRSQTFSTIIGDYHITSYQRRLTLQTQPTITRAPCATIRLEVSLDILVEMQLQTIVVKIRYAPDCVCGAGFHRTYQRPM